MSKAIEEQSAHILVVDDDERIRTLLKRYLSENGLRVSTAGNGAEARELLGGVEFDLLILDVMMPGLSGFDLTEKIRATSNVPILLLTARGLPEDRIQGLERGADDYLSKPFEPRELLLRIGALLRRTRPIARDRQTLAFGDTTFEPGRGELRRGGGLIKLTAGELALMRVLAAKPGEAISRLALAEQTSTPMERSIDVQITRIRKKIEDDPRTPIYLQTVRGVGYMLIPD
jgi:two-component system phosphate regulon response regulator OmpR